MMPHKTGHPHTPTVSVPNGLVEFGGKLYPIHWFHRLVYDGRDVDCDYTGTRILLRTGLSSIDGFKLGVAFANSILAEQGAPSWLSAPGSDPIVVEGLTVEVATVRRLQCPFCRCRLKFRSGLRRHLHAKHPERLPAQERAA